MKISFALALLALLAAGCHKPAEPASAGPSLASADVRVQAAERRSRPVTEEVVGTVRARLRATIEAKISGRVEQMLVVPGQTVPAGELLARVDAREVQSRLDQAMALREQAASDLKRYTTLRAQGTVTEAEFEARQAGFRVAEANVAEVQTTLGHARVTAPFAGVITRKLADVGDLATPGRGLLEMEDSTTLRLEADVPEALFGRVQMGARLPVRLAALNAITEGTVSEISPIADPQSRTFLVKLDLPAVAGLRAGLFGRTTLVIGESAALRVPAAAVVTRGQMEMVFVAEQQTARLRLVKTGKPVGSEIEILAGIEPGEPVVIEGAATLRDGQPLSLKP